MRHDLAPRLKLPLDAGLAVRGRRVFGENKTLRGALMMSGGTLAATVVLTRSSWFRSKLPPELSEASPLAYGALLGSGVVAGELPNSFLKRQLGIGPGDRRATPGGMALAVFDQGDFVLGCWATLAPLWRMTPRQLLRAFATVAAVHAGVNVVGYAIGARSSPV
jgi:CDP-archaeol synthase